MFPSIHFHPVHVLVVRWFACRQHIYENCLLIQRATLCLWIEEMALKLDALTGILLLFSLLEIFIFIYLSFYLLQMSFSPQPCCPCVLFMHTYLQVLWFTSPTTPSSGDFPKVHYFHHSGTTTFLGLLCSLYSQGSEVM